MVSEDRTEKYVIALCRHIDKGRLDKYLDVITNAGWERKKRLRESRERENLIKLRPGTRVQIDPNIKPRYLGGLKGTVIQSEGPRPRSNKRFLSVRLDDGRVGRFGPVVNCPPASLTKCKDQTPHPNHGYTHVKENA